MVVFTIRLTSGSPGYSNNYNYYSIHVNYHGTDNVMCPLKYIR